MDSASLALLLLLASPIVLLTKDVNAASDPSPTPAARLLQLERRLQQYQHQHQEDRELWKVEKRVLENNVKSFHAELRSERLQWLGQQQALENDVRSVAVELKSEKQEWLGQQQALENDVRSVAAQLKSEKQEWLGQQQALENDVRSVAAQLKSEKQEWLGQQQALENDVRSVAAQLKSEKQEWLGEKQILENNAKSLQTEIQALSLKVEETINHNNQLSLKVHTLQNTLSGLTSSVSISEKYSPTNNVEKRSDSMQTSKSTKLQQLEFKMDHELRALNTTVTHDVQQLRTQMTSCQTAVTSATHDLDLMQNQLTAVKQTALVALREASHIQSMMDDIGGFSRASESTLQASESQLQVSESQLQAVNARIDSEVHEMNQRLNGAAQTLHDELVLIVKVLNTKTDTEVTQLAATLHSQAGALNLSVAMATQGVQAVGSQMQALDSQMQAVDSRVQAVEQAITRQDAAGGSAYTRWGKWGCPASSQLVYNGWMAGVDKTSGSMLCLPPQHNDVQQTAEPQEVSHILGAEYRTSTDRTLLGPICAVCHTPRSTTITVPTTTECPAGWTRDYSGYLMSGAAGKKAHDLICVDSVPLNKPYPSGVYESVPLYQTVIACGSLPCYAYTSGAVVTCAVCSI